MSASQRRKGSRIEREIVRLLRDAGIRAERVPLSGAAGGSFTGDVVIAGRWRAEVKARKDGAGFATLERWLGDADLLVLRRDRAAPLVLVPWPVYVGLVRSAHAYQNGDRSVWKALQGVICARPGCGRLLPVGERKRGSPRRFCSPRCRWQAWAARGRAA